MFILAVDQIMNVVYTSHVLDHFSCHTPAAFLLAATIRYQDHPG